MALITLPTIVPISVHPRLLRGDVPLEKMGGGAVIVAPPYAVWAIAIPLEKVSNNANARAWRSALARISKLSNTCQIVPPGYSGPGTGYAGPAPLVAGAGQLGLSLAADGVTPSAAIALDGDFASVNGEFKLLTADATANGTGQVTFNFEPALRQPPADNATIEIFAPIIVMRSKRAIAEWEYAGAMWHDFVLDLIEAF